MTVRLLLLLIALLATGDQCIAQDPCNCESSPRVKKYMNHTADAQITTQCAYLALYLCKCKCPDFQGDREQLKKMIATSKQNLEGSKQLWNGEIFWQELLDEQANCVPARSSSGSGNGQGGSGSQQGPTASAQFNQSLVDFANQLAPFTNDPDAKKMVKDMNDVHTGFGVTKEIFNAGGVGDKTTEFFDNAETVAQIAVIGYNLFKKKEQVLTEEHYQAIKFIGILNDKVLEVYNNLSAFPKQQSYTSQGLEVVDQYEKQINNYDKATAMQRMLIWKYLTQEQVPTINEVKSWVASIQQLYQQKGLQAITAEIETMPKNITTSNTSFRYIKGGADGLPDAAATYQNYLNKSGRMSEAESEFVYLLNGNKALQSEMTEVLLYKSQYYYSIGDEERANAILDQLSQTARYEDLKKVIESGFDVKRYKTAATFYPAFSSMWLKAMNSANDNASYTALMKDIPVIAKGILSMAKSGKHTNAAVQLDLVSKVFYNYLANPQKQKRKRKDYIEPFTDHNIVKAYFFHAQAEILLKEGQFDAALKAADSAVHYASSSGFFESFYTYRVRETKVDILILSKRLEQALTECKDMQQLFMGAYGGMTGNNYDVNEIKFMQAVIYFNMGKHQQALNTITVLKALKADWVKAYVLEKEVHLAMNNKAEADRTETELKKLLN